jgi:hypothetical protein
MELALRCTLAAPKKARILVGATQNISRTGLLIRWNTVASWLPQPGDWIAVELELPGAYDPFKQRWLRCSGRVAWVSDAGNEVGLVAVKVRRMEFCSHPRRKPLAVVIESGAASQLM